HLLGRSLRVHVHAFARFGDAERLRRVGRASDAEYYGRVDAGPSASVFAAGDGRPEPVSDTALGAGPDDAREPPWGRSQARAADRDPMVSRGGDVIRLVSPRADHSRLWRRRRRCAAHSVYVGWDFVTDST